MKRILIFTLLVILFALSACSTSDETQNFDKTVLTESPFVMECSGDGVEDFLKLNTGYKSGYENDTCYNITPAFIQKNADYRIFKYDQSCESFLLYQGNRYPIGAGFGGYGLTSLALADIHRDGLYDLFYTFSWGSGIHRSQVGYFDASTNTEHIFDYSCVNEDMLLCANEGSMLLLKTADVDLSSFVEMKLTEKSAVGKILFQDNEVELVIDDEYAK